MKRRTGRLPSYILLIDALLAIFIIYLSLNSKRIIYSRWYDAKLRASIYTETLFREVKEERLKRGIPIDPTNDPHHTGLIGVQISPITTDFGDLSAKITSVNPNFSALFVQFLKELHIKRGDLVAVHFTGSFPALNLAMLSAMKELDLEPIIITSLGSSMWGANIPEFTYLDIENVLYSLGLLPFKTVFASLGGIDDVGRGLSPEGRELLRKAIERCEVKEIVSKDLLEAIENKLALYDSLANGRQIRCFINIGGNASVLAGVELPSGIVSFEHRKHPGIAGKFLSRGIPVVNISNVFYLARKYGLEIQPASRPEVGKGRLFFEVRYSVWHAGVYLAILILALMFTLIFDVDYYLKKILRRE